MPWSIWEFFTGLGPSKRTRDEETETIRPNRAVLLQAEPTRKKYNRRPSSATESGFHSSREKLTPEAIHPNRTTRNRDEHIGKKFNPRTTLMRDEHIGQNFNPIPSSATETGFHSSREKFTPKAIHSDQATLMRDEHMGWQFNPRTTLMRDEHVGQQFNPRTTLMRDEHVGQQFNPRTTLMRDEHIGQNFNPRTTLMRDEHMGQKFNPRSTLMRDEHMGQKFNPIPSSATETGFHSSREKIPIFTKPDTPYT